MTTVCSDKTGTLTKNEMTVRRIVTPVATYDVTGLGYEPDGAIEPVDGAVAGGDLAAILAVATLCNDAHIVPDPSTGSGTTGWALVGEPTEGALKVVAMKGGVDGAGSGRLAVLPFDSANKFMATLNGGAEGARAILVKGAPDRLLERSRRPARRERPRAARRRRAGTASIDELSAQGLRVLAAARRAVGPAVDERRRRTTSRTSSSSACGASSIRRGPRRSTRSRTATPPGSASR